MSTELRRTGISVIGDVSWGTHFCHFYETKHDLLDTLVPYFKAGLESNEYCLWVVSDSELITVEEAKKALAQAVPDLNRHLSEENIEIVNGHDWYFENNVLSLDSVASAWDARVKRALARGFDGLRASADTFWLAENDLQDFCHYEKQVTNWITDQAMTVMCTYPLWKRRASEIFDVLQVHQFTTARRQGEWQVIQTPDLLIAKAEIRRLNEELQRIVKESPQPPFILRYGVAVIAVAAALTINHVLNINLVGAPAMLFLCAVMFSAWYGGVKPSLLAMPLAVLAFAYYFVTPVNSWSIDPREIPRLSLFVMACLFVISLSAAQRRAAGSLSQARDVLAGTVEELKRTNEALRTENTERKRAEGALDERLRFEALVTELSASCANLSPNELDSEIEKWLKTLVEFLGVDRASFLQFEEDWTTVLRTHSYTVPGVEPLPPAPIGLNVQFPWITDQLRRGVTVKWSRIPDDMAEEAVKERAYAAKLGLKSGLNIPVRVGGSVIGAITFTSVATYRDWPDAMVARLRLVGEIFAAAVERKRAEAELTKEKEILEKIFDNIPVMIGFVGEDGRVKLVNPEWERKMGWTLKELQDQNVDIFAEAYPDVTYRQEILDFVSAATGESVDLKIRVRDGRVIDAACAVVRLSDGTKVALAQDITERKQAEEGLKATTEQMRALSARIHAAKEEEGTRIAREIHDELGGALTSLKWDLEDIDAPVLETGDRPDLQEQRKKILSMVMLIDATINTVRRIASELRPIGLDDLGLVAAIDLHARKFQERTGIIVECDCELQNLKLSQDQSTAIFRIFQEALTNILRHSQATRVNIQTTEEDGEFILTIVDNGRGITGEEGWGKHTLGLLGMRERAHLIGGTIDITGSAGKGTVVTLRISTPSQAGTEKSK